MSSEKGKHTFYVEFQTGDSKMTFRTKNTILFFNRSKLGNGSVPLVPFGQNLEFSNYTNLHKNKFQFCPLLKIAKINQKLRESSTTTFQTNSKSVKTITKKNVSDSVASWLSTPRKRQPAAAMFAPILILTKKKLWWKPISNGEKPNKNKNNIQEKPNQKINSTLKNDMLSKVVKLWRCSDGWQHCSRSCQKIKVFKLKVRSVLVVQNHRNHTFRKWTFAILSHKGDTKPSAQGNQIFTINLKYFVN